MPIISLIILRFHSYRQPPATTIQRSVLGVLLMFSAVTHIAAFSIALFATLVPQAFSPETASYLHIMNSLFGVADITHDTSGILLAPRIVNAAWNARLRQINEMTGTSSGFFMAAGILCRALDARGQHVTIELVMWMFLVSLIAGPAAGSAAVLLLGGVMARRWNRLFLCRVSAAVVRKTSKGSKIVYNLDISPRNPLRLAVVWVEA